MLSFPNSSTRSIKRKKFDDELVESSLNMGGSNLTPIPVRGTSSRFSISGGFFSSLISFICEESNVIPQFMKG